MPRLARPVGRWLVCFVRQLLRTGQDLVEMEISFIS